MYHACAAFTVEGPQVELTLFKIKLKNWAKRGSRYQSKVQIFFQMLVVAGGADAALQLIASTEVDGYRFEPLPDSFCRC